MLELRKTPRHHKHAHHAALGEPLGQRRCVWQQAARSSGDEAGRSLIEGAVREGALDQYTAACVACVVAAAYWRCIAVH